MNRELNLPENATTFAALAALGELSEEVEKSQAAAAAKMEELAALRAQTAELFAERLRAEGADDEAVSAAKAMWAENPSLTAQAALGVDIAEAANPYGCNQYGEGWRQPHNGKRSTPGKPAKKGEQKDEPEQEKKKETDERSSPIGKAKTREEAIAHSRSLLSENFREKGLINFSDGITLEMLNEFNSVVGGLVEKYPTSRLSVLGSYVAEDDSEGAHAAHWCIEINEDNKSGGVWGLRNWKSYNSFRSQATGFSRHNVGATKDGISMKDVLTHEYGHVIQSRIAFYYQTAKEAGPEALAEYKSKNPEEFRLMSEWEEVFEKAKTEKGPSSLSDCQKYLSEYSIANNVEFFAEAFAARERGEKIPEYIETALDNIINHVVIKRK